MKKLAKLSFNYHQISSNTLLISSSAYIKRSISTDSKDTFIKGLKYTYRDIVDFSPTPCAKIQYFHFYRSEYALHEYTEIKTVSMHTIKLSPGPKVMKLFSCSTQLSMKFIQLVKVEMPIIVNILTFRSRINN